MRKVQSKVPEAATANESTKTSTAEASLPNTNDWWYSSDRPNNDNTKTAMTSRFDLDPRFNPHIAVKIREAIIEQSNACPA